MTQVLTKKRLIVYVLIFAIIAFLIVFLSGKRSLNLSSDDSFENGGMLDTPPHGVVASVPLAINDEVELNARKSIDSSAMMTEDVIPQTQAQDISATATLNTDKKVIKTGTIDMQVNSVEKAIKDIQTIAISHGGDEISSDFSKSDTYKNGYIIIKVPVNEYTKAFEQIKSIAPLVTHESSQVQDVTAEFVDLETRIKNKKNHEEKLRSFFDKADKVDELIQVERELARVRTEIEQMEGQLKYLKDQTQYSIIHTSLMEDATIVVSDSWRPMQVVKDSFNTLIHKSTNLINATIRFVITSLPFIIIFIIIAWFLYFSAKHIFKKNN